LLNRQQMLRRYWLRVAEVAALLLFVALAIVVVGLLMRYILPFILGWLVAVLLVPLVRLLERWNVPRLLATLIVLLLLVLFVIVLFVGVIVGVAREAPMLTLNSEHFLARGSLWIQEEIEAGRVFYGELPPQVATQIQRTFVHVLALMELWFQHFASGLLRSVTHLPETLFLAVITVITAFFLLIHRERMLRRFYRMLPPGWSDKVASVVHDVYRAFGGTIRVQLVLMLLSAGLGMLGMWVLHFRYAVILGLLFGLFGVVPMLGSALMTVPWAIGALVVGDVSVALKVIGLQVVISILRHLIEPKFLADNVGLDTLSTLFALYVGLQSIGFLGLFVGPIVLIGIRSLFATHLFEDFFPGTEEETRSPATEE
jgi:sporulation integral membrane protein YtvI